ncbi:MAG: hypothetical protein KIT69_16090 [Propionibacteriaceae bacterium]|nr:hypothetical protein [Propionibacteriaceae bacterium]
MCGVADGLAFGTSAADCSAGQLGGLRSAPNPGQRATGGTGNGRSGCSEPQLRRHRAR